MEKELNRLKAELRTLKVDSRIDFRLETAIKKGSPAFELPYRMDIGKDIVLFDLHFIRRYNKPIYRLDHYVATLLQPIYIPDMVVDGVSLVDLQRQLKHLVAEKGQSGQLPMPIEDAIPALYFLRQSLHGDRLADLILARYIPGAISPDRFGYQLGYDNGHGRFCVSRKFSATAKTDLQQCYKMLAGVMEAKVPKFSLMQLSEHQVQRPVTPATSFKLTAEVVSIKSGQKLFMYSTKSFVDAADPARYLTAIDPRLFDRQFVLQHAGQFNYYLQSVFMHEADNRKPLLTIGNTIPQGRNGVKLELSITHPTLGSLSFGQPAQKKATGNTIADDIAQLQHTLLHLGLLPQRKNITTKKIPPLKSNRTGLKRRGGGKDRGNGKSIK